MENKENSTIITILNEMNQQIIQISENLSQKIDEVNENLNQKIDQVNENLNQKIDHNSANIIKILNTVSKMQEDINDLRDDVETVYSLEKDSRKQLKRLL